MKKALVIGNDEYKVHPLSCCVSDAASVHQLLERNGDASPNFAAKKYADLTSGDIEYHIKELFDGCDDIALLYYAGHGCCSSCSCGIVGTDGTVVPMDYIMAAASNSKHRNKILIFDSCFSGAAGNLSCDLFGYNQIVSALAPGITIMAACRADQTAEEAAQLRHGVFTSLLVEALQGGAANLQGDITPGAIYAYVDRCLGPWQQRPVFKTNVDSFCPIRSIAPPIDAAILRKIPEYFTEASSEFPLDPSYEYTNKPSYEHRLLEPYANPRNVDKFKDLQKLTSVGLVKPIGAEHMYYAAMNSKSCKLTALGGFYWQLVKEGKI